MAGDKVIGKEEAGMKRRGWTAIAVAMLLVCMTLLSGCSAIGLDSKALMSPPRESGDRGKVQSLLIENAGGDLTFRYPHKGEYRSAIITKDITGDRKDDALALYEASDGSGGTTVSFMSQQDGEWSIIRSFTNPAVQVDRICFADLDDDGMKEVVIGWGNSTMNVCTASIYDYTQDGILEIPMEYGYGEMAVTNLINDTQDELFIATVSSENMDAVGQIVRLSKGALQIVQAVSLDSTVLQYSQVSVGMISQNQKGIILDGLRADNSMVTQVIYWDEEKETLEAPYSGKSSQTMNVTSRNAASAYTSRDIDRNSIIEFPIVNALPGSDMNSKDPVTYLINWSQFDVETQSPIRVMSTVMNSRDGFWYLFPESWRGKVTCRSDADTHSTVFYEWLEDDGTGTPALGTALLKIQVFSAEDWKTQGKGYTSLVERGGLIYGVLIPEPDHELAPSLREVKESFDFLSTE